MERILSIGLHSSCHNDFYRNQIRTCQKTWVKNCPHPIYYFAGSCHDDEFLCKDNLKIHHFDVIDNHDSCMIKQFRGLQYLYDHSPSQFYFFGDTDTYVNIPNLEKLLTKYSFQDDLYLGGHGYFRDIGKSMYYHSGGAGFILSHCSLGKLYPLIDQILQKWALICQNFNCPYLFSAADVTISYYLYSLKIYPTIVDGFHACNYQGYDNGLICCREINHETAISYHRMKSEDMLYYYSFRTLSHEKFVDNWTMVTAVYDKKSLNSLIFSLNQNLVILCSLETYSDINRLRRNYSTKTHVIITDIRNHPFYYLLNTHNQSFFLKSSKFFFLQEVIKLNPFSSSHFGWVECLNDRDFSFNFLSLSSALQEKRDLFSLCLIDYIPEETILNKEVYFSQLRSGFSGKFFTGKAEILLEVCRLFHEILQETLKEGWGETDEQLIYVIYIDHPDLFEFYFGDYGQTIINYSHIHENPFITLNNFIPKVLADKKYSLGYKAAEKLYDSYQKGLFYLSPNYHIILLELYFITSWMTDRAKCLSLVEEIKGLIEKPNYLKEFYGRQKYLFHNLDLSYHLLPLKRNVAVYSERRLPPADPQTRIFLYGNYVLSQQSFITENPIKRPRDLKSDVPYAEEIHPTITFVTSFFDLGKRENNTERRQVQVYLEKGLFLLGLDINLVIFIEEQFVDYVTEHRKAFMEKTKIIPMKFEDLHYYQHYDEIVENLKLHPIHNSSSYKDTPNYIILMWEKLEFVKRVIEDNPFKSDYVGWIDFGLTHVATTRKCLTNETFKKVPEKIKIMKLREFSYNEFNDLKTYYSYLRGIMAAGYITGSIENMLIFHRLMNIEINRCLEMKVAPVDEQILPIVISKCPDLFILYNGDYEDILDNYY